MTHPSPRPAAGTITPALLKQAHGTTLGLILEALRDLPAGRRGAAAPSGGHMASLGGAHSASLRVPGAHMASLSHTRAAANS